jgi:hypothetical protein
MKKMIFAGFSSYNQRTGANANSITTPFRRHNIGGTAVKAGSYAYTKPGESKWEVTFTAIHF